MSESLSPSRVLYVGRDITVVYYPQSDLSVCESLCITLDYFRGDTDWRSRKSPAPWFHKIVSAFGSAQIHVFCSNDMWFQTPEIFYIKEIIEHVATGARKILFGASMGGYGALKLAPLLQPNRTIAMSPQTFISPKDDPRFAACWGRLEEEYLEAECKNIVILVDPNEPYDLLHVKSFLKKSHAVVLNFPFHSHWIDTAFNQKGLLNDLVYALLEQDLDFQKINALRRLNRRTSDLYMERFNAYFSKKQERGALARRALGRADFEI